MIQLNHTLGTKTVLSRKLMFQAIQTLKTGFPKYGEKKKYIAKNEKKKKHFSTSCHVYHSIIYTYNISKGSRKKKFFF